MSPKLWPRMTVHADRETSTRALCGPTVTSSEVSRIIFNSGLGSFERKIRCPEEILLRFQSLLPPEWMSQEKKELRTLVTVHFGFLLSTRNHNPEEEHKEACVLFDRIDQKINT